MNLIMSNYLSETKQFKTVRNIIDFQYEEYTQKVQRLEQVFVALVTFAFLDRMFLFNESDASYIVLRFLG